jgi:hypothetical protein
MPRFFATLLCALVLVSCSTNENEMMVTGTVEGLKKGTLYFQKVEDTTLVTLDSLVIDGDPSFTFTTNVDSPEVFFLYLDKADGNAMNDMLEFFGEPGNINITTTHDYFAAEAKVEGSASHEKYAEYSRMMAKFSEKNLNLIKESLVAGQNGDMELADSLNNVREKNNQRGYLYTVNFAFNNADSYVTPYIAMNQLGQLGPKYLDSLSQAISPEVANSKYGKLFTEFIEEIKNAPKTDADTAAAE